MDKQIELIEELIGVSEGVGATEFGAQAYPGELNVREVRQIEAEGALYAQLNSLRLIVRNAQSELGLRGNHWLLRDLKAAERWLNGETREITSEGL